MAHRERGDVERGLVRHGHRQAVLRDPPRARAALRARARRTRGSSRFSADERLVEPRIPPPGTVTCAPGRRRRAPRPRARTTHLGALARTARARARSNSARGRRASGRCRGRPRPRQAFEVRGAVGARPRRQRRAGPTAARPPGGADSPVLAVGPARRAAQRAATTARTTARIGNPTRTTTATTAGHWSTLLDCRCEPRF